MNDFFDHIENYCENQLSLKDKALFEQELKSNAELRKAVENYPTSKDMASALLEMDILESIEHAKGNPRYETNLGEGKKVSAKINGLWLSMFVVFITLLAYAYISYKDSNENKSSKEVQFAQVYKEPIWPIVRSTEDTLMQKAMFLFLQKDEIEDAKFLVLQDTLISEEMRRYWVAEMYLKMDNLDSVKMYLPNVNQNHVKAERIEIIRGYLKNHE